MSSDLDTTRIVRAWLDEGVAQLPDRVLDAVLDQVPTTPQRRATWWPARRLPIMNAFVRWGLAAAVVAVVAYLGLSFLGGAGNVGGPPAATPTPTAEPTPVPTPSSTPAPPREGLLPIGPHVLTDGQDVDGTPTLATTVTIAADDWYGEPGFAIVTKLANPDPPQGAGLIVFFGDLFVYGDPCEWSSTRPDTPVITPDELVTALAAQALRDASEPVDITLDGYSGKAITLHVPDDQRFSDCDESTFGSWGVPGDDPGPYRYHQGPGQIDEVWAVDVDGMLAVIDWAYYEGTPQSVVDEMRAIVESITFD